MKSNEDCKGLKVTPASAVVKKNENNLLGISIGGGAITCPCLYVVQVFDDSPVAKDGNLECGDELLSINGQSVKGNSKAEVARLIHNSPNEVTIGFNKLHADFAAGKTIDIMVKKAKHRLIDRISNETADAFGLSRAILCNDSLATKLTELEKIEETYRGLVDRGTQFAMNLFALCDLFKNLGDCLTDIGVHDLSPIANEVFVKFGECHRQLAKHGLIAVKKMKQILSALGTYLTVAIPDTKLTLNKYSDAKYEYLSYCLKVKEMDDEEQMYAGMREMLYRVETGNYEYRLILKCRQEARKKFGKLRVDVAEKLELLSNKHVEDTVYQMKRVLLCLYRFHSKGAQLMRQNKHFPIEVGLPESLLRSLNKGKDEYIEDDDDDDDGSPENKDDNEDAVKNKSADDNLVEVTTGSSVEDLLNFEGEEMGSSSAPLIDSTPFVDRGNFAPLEGEATFSAKESLESLRLTNESFIDLVSQLSSLRAPGNASVQSCSTEVKKSSSSLNAHAPESVQSKELEKLFVFDSNVQDSVQKKESNGPVFLDANIQDSVRGKQSECLFLLDSNVPDTVTNNQAENWFLLDANVQDSVRIKEPENSLFLCDTNEISENGNALNTVFDSGNNANVQRAGTLEFDENKENNNEEGFSEFFSHLSVENNIGNNASEIKNNDLLEEPINDDFFDFCLLQKMENAGKPVAKKDNDQFTALKKGDLVTVTSNPVIPEISDSERAGKDDDLLIQF